MTDRLDILSNAAPTAILDPKADQVGVSIVAFSGDIGIVLQPSQILSQVSRGRVVNAADRHLAEYARGCPDAVSKRLDLEFLMVDPHCAKHTGLRGRDLNFADKLGPDDAAPAADTTLTPTDTGGDYLKYGVVGEVERYASFLDSPETLPG